MGIVGAFFELISCAHFHPYVSASHLQRNYQSLDLFFPAMAKSKNHTGHNQVYKNHRNGIKKTRQPRKMSMSGMNCKFIRNQAFAKRGIVCSAEEKEQRLAAQ